MRKVNVGYQVITAEVLRIEESDLPSYLSKRWKLVGSTYGRAGVYVYREIPKNEQQKPFAEVLQSLGLKGESYDGYIKIRAITRTHFSEDCISKLEKSGLLRSDSDDIWIPDNAPTEFWESPLISNCEASWIKVFGFKWLVKIPISGVETIDQDREPCAVPNTICVGNQYIGYQVCGIASL